MRGSLPELGATVLTVAGLTVALWWPFHHERSSVAGRLPPGAAVVVLTGVAATGTWTEEEVTSSNYWRTFAPARPVWRVGQPVLLRLKSADVLHSFYCPSLGLGPVEVQPGHVVEILVTPAQEGVFSYYCTTFCGDPHFGMRGEIVVTGTGRADSEPRVPSDPYWLAPPPTDASKVERGRWLYQRYGCVACHGPGGRGGVPNWNYINNTVPKLNTLAEKMMLTAKEDADEIIKALEQGKPLASLADDPPVPRFNVVLAQYQAVRDVMRKGNPPGKKNAQGPAPPLEMPAWGQRLTGEDLDAILAYLLTLQPWENETK